MEGVPLFLRMARRRAQAELGRLKEVPLDEEDDCLLGEHISREEMRAKRIVFAEKCLRSVDLEIETGIPHDVCTLEPIGRKT